MSIDKIKIEEIAKLARIKLSDVEKEKYAEQFASILEYFEQLKEVDTENIEIFDSADSIENITREDIVKKCDKKITDAILDEIPDKKNKFMKVKKVL
ncbi:MAG: Asp-tRNA(Asn)/Glu-tRNA(Gln) amidotransferase subunit GatC [bacterium]